MKYNNIIMFCDYGLDDAIATMHILANAHMFERIYIVPIGGNVDVNVAYRNAHTLLAAAHADKNKVTIVDTRAIKQFAADIPDVHGNDGIGDILEAAQSELRVLSFAEFKAELEKNHEPSRDCVLSLGPCTVPNMLNYVPFCTVLMGGRNKEEPNYGDYEFNEACDVAAFKTFASTATAVATLDTCHDPKFGFDSFTMGEPLSDRLIAKYNDMCKARNAPVAVYDYCAALAVTDPEKFEVTRIRRTDGVEFNELKLRS